MYQGNMIAQVTFTPKKRTLSSLSPTLMQADRFARGSSNMLAGFDLRTRETLEESQDMVSVEESSDTTFDVGFRE